MDETGPREAEPLRVGTVPYLVGRPLNLGLVRDVDLGKFPADLRGNGISLFLVQIHHDDFGAVLREQASRRGPQPRRTTRHQCRSSVDI